MPIVAMRTVQRNAAAGAHILKPLLYDQAIIYPFLQSAPHKTATLLKGYRHCRKSEGEAGNDRKMRVCSEDVLANGALFTRVVRIGAGLRHSQRSG